MRNYGKAVLVLGVAVLLASTVLAQQPERPGGLSGRFGFGPGGGGGLGLLSNRSVQEELKLSDEQAQKVQQAAREIRERHQGDFQKLQDLQGAERRERAQEVMRTVAEDSRKALDGVLTPEQTRRLRQITLQARGADAFSDQDVQERLNLSDEQKAKIRDINEDAREDRREIIESADEDREGAARQLAELRRGTLAKVVVILTPAQKETWTDLTGELFQIRFERPGGAER